MGSNVKWDMNRVGSQAGKTVLITGSNTGIGFATAMLLARKGAAIVMACRNTAKGQQALARIAAAAPAAPLSLVQLDLASLDSVRACATEVTQKCARLDVLINNAGLMMPPLQRTTDGFEIQFGTNVLGHFAFTGLLSPLLLRSPASRVVWLSSLAHWTGRIDFDNLNAERHYGKWRAYAQSKLADLMLAYEMQRRLQRSGATTIALGAHPGGTKSDLSRNNGMLQLFDRFGGAFIQATEDGAMPSVRAAVDPDAVGGDYYGPGGFATFTGPATKQRSSRRSHDEAVAIRLWERCEQLTAVHWLD